MIVITTINIIWLAISYASLASISNDILGSSSRAEYYVLRSTTTTRITMVHNYQYDY